MTGPEDERGLGKIGDLVQELKQRKIPVVSRRATVSEIVDAFVESNHSRLLYVTDDEGRLRGVISLGNLVRHVFFLYHNAYVNSRNLVSMATSERAQDFMHREPLFAMVSEDVEDVLQRMIDNNIKEIPILDEEKRIVGDITMVDLLKHHKYAKGADPS